MHLSHELLVITGTSLVIGLIRSAYFKTPQWRTSLSPSWSLTSFLAVHFHCPSSMSVRELVPAAMWGSHRSERLGVEYLSHGISGLWRKWTEEQTQGKKKKIFSIFFSCFSFDELLRSGIEKSRTQPQRLHLELNQFWLKIHGPKSSVKIAGAFLLRF